MKKSKLPKQALIILSIALVLVISTVMWSSAQITQDTEEEVLPGITNTLQDRLGTPEPINVFSIPVYDQSDSIIGVLFATYRNQHFEEVLSVQSFNNQGFSCLVNQDGDLIATSSNAPASLQEADRISDYLTQDARNDQPLQDLHTLLQSSSSSGGHSVSYTHLTLPTIA